MTSNPEVPENNVPEKISDNPFIIQPNDDTGHTVRPQQAKSEPVTSDDTVSLPRVMFNYIVIAVVFLGVGMFLGLNVNSGGGMSDLDAAAIEQLVINAVMEANGEEPIDMVQMIDDDPYLGPEDAPVVIVEFSAYACPYCGRHYNTTLEPLLDTYGDYIRYVFRDFPTINPNVSQPAALAANCANEQGKFWEYHEFIFSNQQDLASGGMSFLNEAAEVTGLDTAAFTECFDDFRYVDEIENDYYDGLLNNVSGTPAFFINGEVHSGALPYEYFEKVVERELAKQGITLPDA